MPIVIKDFSWRQTENLVTILVPIRSNHMPEVDVFTCPDYVKSSYDKYFFEAFLLHSIDTDASKCTITPQHIVFELVKLIPQAWETLEIDLSRAEKQQLKQKVLNEAYERIREKDKQKRNEKHELKREAVRQQISLDTKQRQLIENRKEEAKSDALGDLKSWQKNLSKTFTAAPPTPKPRTKTPKIPEPRSSGAIEVAFTPREFPTPCRESMLPEENEWLRKQAEARRTAGFACEDLRPEEKNPQYLKAKGDEFLKAKNYLGAISAYSFGIKVSPQFVDLYIGRSQAHLEVGNYNKVLQDCSCALDLMKPAVEANLSGRIVCIARRGQALCKIGLARQGLEEIDAACVLARRDKHKLEELEKLRDELEDETS